jgi:hypothetical protein
MKTKILLALLFLFTICTSINAGDFLAKHKSRGHGGGEPKLIISASVGAGIPLGHFGKADTLAQSDTTHRNGYAKPGFHFNGSIGYRFTDNIGAMIQIGGNMNSFNTGTYSTQLAAQDGIVSPATLTTTATNNYIGSYLIGPVFTLPVSDQIDVDIKLLVGLMTMQFSDLTLNVNDPSIPATYVGIVATTATSTFAYGAGASIRFKASDMLGFKVGIDYIGGNPSFSSLKTVSGTSSGTLPKQSMTVGLLNISAGIVLGF